VKCLIDPDIPLNDGFYRFIHVTAPEASAVMPAIPPQPLRLGGVDATL